MNKSGIVKGDHTGPVMPGKILKSAALQNSDQGESLQSDAVDKNTLSLISQQARLSIRNVTSSRDPDFEKGYKLFQKAYSSTPDELDPKANFAAQLKPDHEVNQRGNRYHFIAVKSNSSGRPAGAATANYLANSNVMFENYSAVSSQRDPNVIQPLLVKGMDEAGAGDAAKNGRKLLGIVLEADQSEISQKRPQGYLLLQGVDYAQPPLGRGMKAVPLPLMLKPTNPDDPSFVKDGNGKIIGIKADKVREIVQDMFKIIYDKDLVTRENTPTTQYASRVLKSLEGKETIPLT